MHGMVAILLLSGLAVVASAGSRCSCSTLQRCMIMKYKDDFEHLDTCQAQCKEKLTKNPSDVLKCMSSADDVTDHMKFDEFECLLKPAGNVCEVSRPRRQTVPAQDPHCTNPKDCATQAAEVNGQTDTDVNVDITDLKPFGDCVNSCLKEMNREDFGPFQGSTLNFARYVRGIEDCSTTEGCTINLQTLNQAAQTCRSSMSDVQARRNKIKQRQCICLRDALGKTTTSMPCA